jgi:hypothetical protein
LEAFDNSNASTIAAVTATTTTGSPSPPQSEMGGTTGATSSVSVTSLVSSVRSAIQRGDQLNQQYSDFLVGLLHKDDQDHDEPIMTSTPLPSSSPSSSASSDQPSGTVANVASDSCTQFVISYCEQEAVIAMSRTSLAKFISLLAIYT